MFLVFVKHRTPRAQKFQHTTSLTVSIQFQPKFMIHTLVTGGSMGQGQILRDIRPDIFFFFFEFWEKQNAFSIFHDFFPFSLILDPTLKRYSSLKPVFVPVDLFFKLLLNFLVNDPHKSTVLDFWNFDFTIFHDLFFVFVNMGPYGSKTPKTLLLPQIVFDFFSNFSWIFFSFSTVLFLIFELTIFHDFFSKVTFSIVSYRETKHCYYRENESS